MDVFINMCGKIRKREVSYILICDTKDVNIGKEEMQKIVGESLKRE